MLDFAFSICVSYHDSIRKLNNNEQKLIKQASFDFMTNPKKPGFSFERIMKSKDKNFWAFRAGIDLRVIVHRLGNDIRFMYVDHHDKALNWPKERRVSEHPITKSLQNYDAVDDSFVNLIVKENDTISTQQPPEPVIKKENDNQIFNEIKNDILLQIGIPEEWVLNVKNITEDKLDELLSKLPEEASEALQDIYLGEKPEKFIKKHTTNDVYLHPDTQRRFLKINDVNQFNKFFDQPWENWMVFLHPEQRDASEKNRNGSAKVSGSAGTGKTVVALHRALNLAKQETTNKILLMSYSKTLSNDLDIKLKLLFENDRNKLLKVKVSTLNKEAYYYYREAHFYFYKTRKDFDNIASDIQIKNFISVACKELQINDFDQKFLFSEWNQIIDAWDMQEFSEYKNIQRLGRGLQLGSIQRLKIWNIFSSLREMMKAKNLQTWNSVFGLVARYFEKNPVKPYSNIIVDEAQDLGPIGLKFIRSLVEKKQNDLFFSGDLGQQIYEKPFSWLSAGVDIRGRSNHLKINYRTSKQIYSLTSLLLPDTIEDVDGNEEERKGVLSVFEGPKPLINFFQNADEEKKELSNWLAELINNGVNHEEIAILCRSRNQFNAAKNICDQMQIPNLEIKPNSSFQKGCVSIMTMHRSKGLEFRAVVIFSCNNDVLPFPRAVQDAEDEQEKKQIIKTEEYILYVACTRAREHLWLSSSSKPSEFIEYLNLGNN